MPELAVSVCLARALASVRMKARRARGVVGGIKGAAVQSVRSQRTRRVDHDNIDWPPPVFELETKLFL